MEPESHPAQVFRLKNWLKVVIGSVIGLWGLIFFILLWQRETIPTQTYLSVLFFIGLFGAVLAFYNGLTITADGYGVTYRGLLSFHNYPYETVLKVDERTVFAGLVIYDVFTRRGLLQFSNFIEGHQRLFSLIGERAALRKKDPSAK